MFKSYMLGTGKTKEEVTEAWEQTLQQKQPPFQISLLTGYLCFCIKLMPTKENIERLEKILMTAYEHIYTEDNCISFHNFIEIVVQAASYQIQPTEKDDDPCANFSYITRKITQQVCKDNTFLQTKWKKQKDIIPQKLSLIKKSKTSSQKITKFPSPKKKQERRESQIKVSKIVHNEEEEELTRKYISQLMKQEQKHKQDMTCMICQQYIDADQIGTLSCQHIFHIKCIRSHIESSVEQKKLDIKCPAGCGAPIMVEDIQDYIDGELKIKFDQFGLDLFAEKNKDLISWCPTAGCTAVFTTQGGLKNYNCPICKKRYCLECRCEYHKGMTCKEYQVNSKRDVNDVKFEEFAKGAKLKQCPKCKLWVEKSAGCVSIKCRCGQQFCYNCGGIDCPHGNCKKNLTFVSRLPGRAELFNPRRIQRMEVREREIWQDPDQFQIHSQQSQQEQEQVQEEDNRQIAKNLFRQQIPSELTKYLLRNLLNKK